MAITQSEVRKVVFIHGNVGYKSLDSGIQVRALLMKGGAEPFPVIFSFGGTIAFR